MIEISGNIWEFLGRAVIVITTNGFVTKQGAAIFGRGCARQAQERFPDLPHRLGRLLLQHGNHVVSLGSGLVAFPVEESPWALPDFHLISRSARELREMADREEWEMVVVPRPGCGGGGLDWREVRPLLEEHFDDRFHVITEGEKGGINKVSGKSFEELCSPHNG